MSSFHLVNVWTQPEPGPGGFNPMAISMLWLPDAFDIGQPRPAFVHAHRWGGYPHDPLPSRLGPVFADAGFAFLSLCLRRRGMEGQLMAMPEDDLQDLKLAIDYLQTNGCTEIFLCGEEAGAASVARYMAKHGDARVRGVVLLDPADDCDAWLRNAVGEAAYLAAVREAGVAARQGAGMDYRIDLFPGTGPAVTQQAAAFLAWWSPVAETRLPQALTGLAAPVAVSATDGAGLPAAVSDAIDGERVQLLQPADGSHDAGAIIEWATAAGGRVLSACDIERVDVESRGTALYGILWTVRGTGPADTLVLLMPGLTSSPSSVLFNKMAPVIAAEGYAALAVESHRSGWAGHETALLDHDNDALDAWMDFAVERGFENIVLAGASMGSLSVGRYQSMRRHPNVVALAHLMPTADCPDWFRAAAGNGPYDEAANAAIRAVERGEGDTFLIDVDVRQPPPSLSRGRFRWTQRAASWLSWWGPDADSRNSVHIANVCVPVLLLSGTADSYNDEARFAELKAAAVNVPRVDEIWYPDIDHGLAGVETQVASDLCAWIGRMGMN